MESKINYTTVGIFVVILTAFIIMISLWLAMSLNQKQYKTYLIYMNESVSGLAPEAPVKYNGVDVGYVSKINLNLKNPQQVILTVYIEEFIPITTTTEAVLTEQGLTGIAFISLQGGAHSPLLTALPGEPYPVIKSAPSFFVRLDQAIQGLTTNVSGLSDNLKTLLDQQNINSIKTTLKNLDTISSALASNTNEFNQSMHSLNTLLQNASNASEKLPDVLQKISNSASAIQNMSNKISTTAKSANSLIKNGNNAIQSFSTELMPETFGAVQNIKSMTSNLNDLSTQLQENPSVVISGTKPPAKGPGE